MLAHGPAPRLELLTFSFFDSPADATETAAQAKKSPAWGKTIDVPQRADNNYPHGGVLCSPTSLSMVLAYYANRLSRPEMNKDVPEVESHVRDPVYKGTGVALVQHRVRRFVSRDAGLCCGALAVL